LDELLLLLLDRLAVFEGLVLLLLDLLAVLFVPRVVVDGLVALRADEDLLAVLFGLVTREERRAVFVPRVVLALASVVLPYTELRREESYPRLAVCIFRVTLPERRPDILALRPEYATP